MVREECHGAETALLPASSRRNNSGKGGSTPSGSIKFPRRRSVFQWRGSAGAGNQPLAVPPQARHRLTSRNTQYDNTTAQTWRGSAEGFEGGFVMWVVWLHELVLLFAPGTCQTRDIYLDWVQDIVALFKMLLCSVLDLKLVELNPLNHSPDRDIKKSHWSDQARSSQERKPNWVEVHTFIKCLSPSFNWLFADDVRIYSHFMSVAFSKISNRVILLLLPK